MNSHALEMLLEKLQSGDADAAGQVFAAYEPYLRVVVRRRLSPGMRAKFDSLDIVQSVWTDVVRGFRDSGWRFADAAHLRAFLVRLTHNRFIDRLRQHRRAVEHEQTLGDADEPAHRAASAHPSEVLAADELWQEMLAQCPAQHRDVLRLKKAGTPSAEIAARTGLHEGSIRRILRGLAQRLAACRVI